MENASAVVEQFHETYDPIKQKLEEILQKYKDNAQFFEFLKQVREGRANLPPEIRGVVESALSDRTVLANLEYVALLEQQEKELNKGPAQFRGSSLGGRILQDILVAKSFAIDQAGDLAKARYDRLIRDMQDLSNQIDTVEIEILNHMRGQLSAQLQQQQTLAGQSTGGRVEVDSEHVVWPFNGEYWRDELGFYRQEVTFMCGR